MTFLKLTASSLLRKLSAFALLLVMLCAALALYLVNHFNSPIPVLISPVTYAVSVGSSLSKVSAELTAAGHLQHPQLFKLLARLRGVENAIKAGEYQLQADWSPQQLLDALVQGNSIQYRVTLVEGWTFAQALAAIRAQEKINKTLTATPPSQIASLMDLEQDNPEGMLFPDTYFYTAGTSDLQILKRANERLMTVLSAAWEQRLGALPYESPYEALIMASIIERESSYGAERGHIAGVFVRRLELGMRLQSDPTVIYGMGERYQGNITRADITAQSLYNTYRIPALPPTPIALAGRDSITASLNPLLSDYLYFVAKGDGEHYFSSTLEEHNAAVRRYQIPVDTQ